MKLVGLKVIPNGMKFCCFHCAQHLNTGMPSYYLFNGKNKKITACMKHMYESISAQL